MTILDRTRIIYKGDKLMAMYYIGLATFLLCSALLLYLFTTKIGWTSLAIGLAAFGFLCGGKGIMIYRVAKGRISYYLNVKSLGLGELKEEMDYNLFRLKKKESNRPKYIYGLAICFILMVIGIAIGEKGYTIGTLVPIMFYTGTEIAVTLLTEFRLWEYHRQLEKEMEY
jgi:hypothetical protein